MWGVYDRGARWRRAPRRAWLVIRTGEHDVVQFDGPELDLMTDARTRFDQRLAALGPDVLAGEFDSSEFIRRLRDDDQTRVIGDALLDQRNVAGLGTIWRSEGCFLAGLSPWRGVSETSDGEALAVIEAVRPLMAESVVGSGRAVTWKPPPGASKWEGSTWVFERTGLPCRRCGTRIEFRGQGVDNRNTYWCPSCQR